MQKLSKGIWSSVRLERTNCLSEATQTFFFLLYKLGTVEFPASIHWREGILHGPALCLFPCELHWRALRNKAQLAESHPKQCSRSQSSQEALPCALNVCVLYVDTDGTKRHPWFLPSKRCVDCRSLRISHLTTRFLMQGGKSPRSRSIRQDHN